MDEEMQIGWIFLTSCTKHWVHSTIITYLENEDSKESKEEQKEIERKGKRQEGRIRGGMIYSNCNFTWDALLELA